MDIFRNLFQVLMGKTNEIDKPIFTKPYVDKTYDMLELARKLDQAPEETKPMFRDAMESLAEKIKIHQGIHDVLENSGLPILILYDVHLLTEAGSATIDYVILSNRFLITLSYEAESGEKISVQADEGLSTSPAHKIPVSEHAAYIFTRLLEDEKLINKKQLKMIWPLTVMTHPDRLQPEQTSASVMQPFSSAFSEIYRQQLLTVEELVNQLKKMFQFDDDFSWLSNREIITISDTLLKYEESTICKAGV